MRSLIPIAWAGVFCTGALFAQDRSITPSQLSVSAAAKAAQGQVLSRARATQDTNITPSVLPPGARAVQRAAAPRVQRPAVNSDLTPGLLLPGASATNTLSGPASGGNTLYDNGSADGVNGYSNATVGAFGARRTILDDFTVPPATTWDVGCIAWTHVYGSGEPAGTGTGAEFDFRTDAGGSPGGVFTTATVTSYSETATGNVFFSRPEIASTATFDCLSLGSGTYWFEGTVVAPVNNFWLTTAQQNSECWVNYDDLGGLQPGSALFGVAADMNFQVLDCSAGTGGCANTLYDNGDADGVNGYSNATVAAFGARRTVLDDFSVPAGESWDVSCMYWTHVYGSGEPAGTGTGAEFDFRDDATGTPGAAIATATVTSYSEVATGNVFFSRPEIASTVNFNTVNLCEGTYWFEGTVVAPVNNFWLTAAQLNGSECWVNYDDLGGLQPGSAIFGTTADMNVQVGGKIAPPCGGGGGCGNTLYDNGLADGVNGYSNATAGAFGFRRTVLDDFTVPASTTWNLGCLSWTHVYGSGEPAGTGTGAEVSFRNDAGGSPGAVFTTATITGYTETATGGVFFSRPEVASTASFDCLSLGAGTYWFEGTVVAPVNNFWLTTAQKNNECWINYDDLGGLQPGSALFGVTADMNFQLGECAGDDVTIYCDETQNPNNSSDISVSGTDLSGPAITVDLSNGPAGQFTYLLIGDGNGSVSNPPGAKGDLCILGGNCLGRYASDIGSISGAGTFSTNIANSASGGAGYGIPTCGGSIQAGQTWNFQYWHRQPMGQPSTFSSAASVTFQ